MTNAAPGSASEPELPDGLDETNPGNRADYVKAKFDKRFDLYSQARKQAWSDQAATVATDRARLDTSTALVATRLDTKAALDASRDDALVAVETASLAAVQAAYIASTQSALDRALTRTNVLTASVGTIITLYTGLLAFIYTKAETATGGETGVNTEPLQPVALIPALFLALALFLATVYAAVLRNKTTVGPFLPSGIGGQIAEMRLVTYMNWCFAGVLARRWALHAGITSLGIGVATLPLPFTNTSDTFHWIVLVGGALVVVLTAALTQFGSWLWLKIKFW